MARGVMATGETRAEAEEQVRREAPHMKILRSRQIDLSGLPPVGGKPLPKHWVVVVEHPDPAREAELPQHADPEEQVERELRLLYLSMVTDPDLVVSGVIEEFSCPVCDAPVRLEFPAPREKKPRSRAACPSCRSPLFRADPNTMWAPAPPRAKTDRRCVFCTNKADSYEHAIPAWISKQLGIKSYLTADPTLSTPTPGQPSRDIAFASYRKRILCTSCNTHFKHLEDEVIPLLVSMARGRPLSLKGDTQRLLALWAQKTAIALVAAGGASTELVPAEHRESVRRRRRPGDACKIDFFAWTGGSTMGTGVAELITRGRSIRSKGYVAFLTFAELGFRVIGFEPPLGPHQQVTPTPPWLLRFWPTAGRAYTWPPPACDDSILPMLFEW